MRGDKIIGIRNKLLISILPITVVSFIVVIVVSYLSSKSSLEEIITRLREFQKSPILQGLQRLWKVVRCVGFQTVCNTYATSMQHEYQ